MTLQDKLLTCLILVVGVLVGYSLYAPLPAGLEELSHLDGIRRVTDQFSNYVYKPVSSDRDLSKAEWILPSSAESDPNTAQLVAGLETVEFDPKDSNLLYGPNEHGQLIKFDLATKQVSVVVELGCRGFGLRFAPNGDLYIATELGLQVFDSKGSLRIVSSGLVNGKPIVFPDDVNVDSNGIVYFSDASGVSPVGISPKAFFYRSLLSGSLTGRLLRYDPTTGETTELLGGLLFANGVAVAKDDDFVLISETGKARVHRYWLKGPKAGQSDIFADGFPGLPDGIRRGESGHFWVACFVPRQLDYNVVSQSILLRRFLLLLPISLLSDTIPNPTHGIAFSFDQDGNLLNVLEDRTGIRVPSVTAVTERDSKLYFGTLFGYVSVWRQPDHRL